MRPGCGACPNLISSLIVFVGRGRRLPVAPFSQSSQACAVLLPGTVLKRRLSVSSLAPLAASAHVSRGDLVSAPLSCERRGIVCPVASDILWRQPKVRYRWAAVTVGTSDTRRSVHLRVRCPCCQEQRSDTG